MKKSVILNGEQVAYDLIERKEKFVSIQIGDHKFDYQLERSPDGTTFLSFEGKKVAAHRVKMDPKKDHLVVGSREWLMEFPHVGRGAGQREDKGGLMSPMPGKIFKVLVKDGDTVVKGQVMLIMEAMKMEHAIKAPGPAKIEAVLYKEGDLVQGGVELIRLAGVEE